MKPQYCTIPWLYVKHMGDCQGLAGGARHDRKQEQENSGGNAEIP